MFIQTKLIERKFKKMSHICPRCEKDKMKQLITEEVKTNGTNPPS